MKLTWGPITQLYTRNLYALVNVVVSLNCWVTLTDEARNELLCWQHLSHLRFDAEIWPSTSGLAIRVATDASDFRMGGHTKSGPPPFVAHVYFTEFEALLFSTYRDF